MSVIKKAVLSVALAAMAVFPVAGENRKEEESAVVDAVTLFSTGKYKEAVKALAGLSREYPENDAVFYYLGLSCCYSGEMGLGEEYLREAVKLDTGNYWYKDYLARICNVNGKPDETIRLYEELLRSNPKKTEISYALVDLYARKGNLDKVLSILDDIERSQGTSEDVTLYKYEVLRHLKKDAEAYEVLEKYNNEYSSERVLSAMGDYNLSQCKDSMALKYYDEALSYVSDFIPAKVGRLETFRMRGTWDEYFDALKEYVGLPEMKLEAKTVYLGDFISRLTPDFIEKWKKPLDEVIDLYLEGKQLDSNAFRLAGSYYYSTGRGSKAVELFEKNAEKYPDSYTLRLYYIQALSLEKDTERLLEACEKASSDFPQIPDFLLIAADSHYLEGNSKEAFRNYEKALKISPDNVMALNNYAYYLCLNGKNLKKALAMSRRTIDVEPDNATYLDTYGWILHLMGRDDEAKPVFKHAMLYGGKDSYDTLLHYSKVLEALGESELSNLYEGMAEKIGPRK